MLGMPAQLFSGGRVYTGYGGTRNARTYMIDCLRGNVADFVVPEDDKELIFQGWEALCDTYCRPVFFEKSPQHLAHWASLSLLAEWISRTSKEVRIIGLIRNPLSVMHSAEERFGTPSSSRQFGWLEIYRNLLSFAAMLPPGAYLQLRYEDIVDNPTSQFSSVCDFVGVPPCDELGSAVHEKSIYKWKEDASFDLQLNQAVKQVAMHYGYSEEDLNNPVENVRPASTFAGQDARRFFQAWPSRIKDRFVTPLSLRWRKKKRFNE